MYPASPKGKGWKKLPATEHLLCPHMGFLVNN